MLMKDKTKTWKYIILGVLMFGTIYSDTTIFLYEGQSAISTLEFIIYIMNHQINICLYLLFFICSITGDIVDNTINKESISEEIFTEIHLKKAISTPIYCIFAYILIGIFAFLVQYGYLDLSNKWSLESGIYLSPIGASLMSTLLLSFRFITFTMIILIINIISKYPIGIIVPIGISIIDYWFYDVFDILLPLNILPIEHTRVFYTEAVAPSSDVASRSSYTISFLYWFIFFTILYSIYKVVANRKYT